jgi:4,5-DOPA dioxygenase extradiol
MSTSLMPVLFMGHGSPMNAIEDNEFSQAWSTIAKALPVPKAILCISAHWETHGTWVTAMDKPRTIHDFGGFPRALYEKQYPAPGAPWLAERIHQVAPKIDIQLDQSWGLDHGTWSVLCRMYPAANVPVVQLSLNRSQDTDFHYALGQQLQVLRCEGILIVGSGNVVHNLRTAVFDDSAYAWATEFDAHIKQCILTGNHTDLIHYEKYGQAALLSVNSAEHYLPLLYILGLQEAGEPVSFFAEKVWGGLTSMRCVQIG